MATGELAFSGNSSGVIFEAILNRNPPDVSTLNPKVPAKLEEVISKALDKDRELRYQTAAELRGDLKRIKRGSGIVARPCQCFRHVHEFGTNIAGCAGSSGPTGRPG